MNITKHLKTSDEFDISIEHTISVKEKLVIWLHGISVNKDEYLNFFKDGAEYLKTHDVDSIRLDFRGHGLSSGSSRDFSIVGQVLDIRSVIEYAKEYYKKDVDVFLVGCSFGAPPAIMTAIAEPLIKKICLISPVLSYKRTFLAPETEWAKQLFNIDTIKNLYCSNQLYFDDDFCISTKLFEEMKYIIPECLIKKVEQPIVVIHGDADSMVPYTVSAEISNRNKRIKFVPIKDMDHGFMDKADEEGITSKSLSNKLHIYELILEMCR